MPSGAKKRKAARKKLHNNQPHHRNHTNNASYTQGSDSGDVERENTEEIAEKNHEGESNIAETADVNPVESHNGDANEEHKSSSGSSSSSDDDEVNVEKDKSVIEEVGDEMVKSDVEIAVKNYESGSNVAETAKDVNPAESHNGDATEEHKNSSGSSDDNAVDVEKDKSVVEQVGDEMIKSDDIVPDVGLSESGVAAEVVEVTVDESIPVDDSIPADETVKEVVLTDPVSDSVPAENLSVPDVVDSELNQALNKVSPPSDEKGNDAFEVENGVPNSSISADNKTRDVEDRSGGDDHVKELEKVKNSEEQPLISSTPGPVRRTSWMNCCGLFEVISGGSGR